MKFCFLMVQFLRFDGAVLLFDNAGLRFDGGVLLFDCAVLFF